MTIEQAKTFYNAILLRSGKAMLTSTEMERIDFSSLLPFDTGFKPTAERAHAVFLIGKQVRAMEGNQLILDKN